MEQNFVAKFKLRPQRKRRKKIIYLLLSIIFISWLLILFIHPKIGLISPLAKIKVDNSLKGVVNNVLEETNGTYAIAIKNLKTGESYFKDEHKVFEVGSLYKLWIMATAFKQIQDGKLPEDEVLSEDVGTLNEEFNIDPEWAELTEGAITLPVRDALNQMITISHNYAALLLTERIKLSSVAAFLQTNGFTESSVGTNGGSPKSTAVDITIFYEKLYQGQFANKQYTDEMLNLLKNQQLNDGLPKYLPDKSKVASKTGDIGWFKHDGGIVFTDKGDYIIVIMSESDNPAGAQERIALISKAVYDYFNLDHVQNKATPGKVVSP